MFRQAAGIRDGDRIRARQRGADRMGVRRRGAGGRGTWLARAAGRTGRLRGVIAAGCIDRNRIVLYDSCG